MALQQELGPLFDITFDCEDGAAAGSEEQHARLVASLIMGEDNRHGRIGARVHDVHSPFSSATRRHHLRRRRSAWPTWCCPRRKAWKM